MPRVQELVERSVATEEGDAEAFQAPLASVSYKEWEEPTTSVSGCKHGPRRLTEGAEEWYNPVENSGIATAAPYNWWIVENKQHRFAEQIEIFYGIYEEDGYWCRLPPVFEDRIHRPPPGYVGVYPKGNDVIQFFHPPFLLLQIDNMGRKRKGRAVVRPGQFPLEESSPSPKRTRLNEGSSEMGRKKTPDSFPVQNQETPNPFSIQNREEEVQQKFYTLLFDQPRHLTEHFVKDIQRQTDAFITRVENNNVLNLKEGSDSLEEDGKCVQVPHQADIPSASAIESFRTFRSNEMGFDFAPLVAVPGAVRNSFLESRNSAVEFFGDFTGLSELERAKIWSTRAAAGASEPFIKVPDPVAENFKLLMQAVQNHVITAGLNEELKSKAETSEHLAQMAELKKKRAEESFLESQSELNQTTEIFRNFYQELEQFFFPQIEQGEELIRSYGAKDIPGLKARIQERFQQEVSAKERLAKELNDKVTLIKEEANKKESDLKEEIKRLNDLILTKDLSLVEAQNQLKAEKDSATKYRADLESARQQLKTQIYTQEQYDEGYENGFKIARRLAIHLEPNINWDEAEKWSMNIDHPKMQHPHPNELALLDRLAKQEALEENDDSEDEDGPQADKVAKSASSAAAKIPTAPDADVVNAET